MPIYVLPNSRTAKRVHVAMPITCEYSDPVDKTIKTKTVITNNISESGIYFSIDEILPLKMALKITFKLPKSENIISAKIKIARIETNEKDKSFGIGASFTEISDKDKKEIQNFVTYLDLGKLLDLAIAKGASDLHLLADHPPVLRIQGELQIQDMPKLSTEDIPNMIFSAMNRQQIEKFKTNKELDFGMQYDLQNRFRVNLHMQRGHIEATLRLISSRMLSFEELKIPDAVKNLARLKDGLVLITGPTGSGKSTTISAMVELINQERKALIITLERPIEYVHIDAKSIIKQREIGVDTNSFQIALQSSLRQDPNVIVVGELDDTETIKTALAAAEAGYLVIASFHAPNTTQAIDRLISVFPSENRKQILAQLSNCLKGIVSQLLLPTIDRKNRVLVTEVLITTEAVKSIIRMDELVQLATTIQTSKKYNMHPMEESIKKYLSEGIIDAETVENFCKELGITLPKEKTR